MKIITVTANPALDITAHVDAWQRGVVNRGQSASVAAGGKGINVAVNLAHSGLEVYATGWLGKDNDAAFRRSFSRDRVNDTFIRIDGETRRNVKIVDATADENTNFNMPGAPIGIADKEALENYLQTHVDEWTVLVFGGSLPPGIKDNYYAKMVEQFRGKCHFIAVDTDGEPLAEVLQADWLPDMIKPNIHELRAVTGKALVTDEEIFTEAKEWVSRGIKIVVISMGDQGAWFVTKDEAVKALPLPVEPVCTVGAGDAMVAGVIHDMIVGCELQEIARTATAYGASNIEHDGLRLPSQARLDSLKDKVELRLF